MNGMFKRAAVALTIAALLGNGHALAAADSSPMQDAMRQYRAQIADARMQEERIRSLKQTLKVESRELRRLVRQAKDEKLREQVKNDLKPFHAHLAKAHELRKIDEELKKEIHAARLQKDLAEERRLAAVLIENKKQQLASLQQAEQALQVELTKIKALKSA
jgi:hypothetical protein